MLGNFGKANALWRERERDAQLRALLDELLALGSDRGGALAFEYFFEFGGGEPPWTSGLSQATALQALGARDRPDRRPEVPRRRHARARRVRAAAAERRARRRRGRAALPDLHVQPGPAGDQRVPAVDHRPLRLRAAHRRPARAGPVRERARPQARVETPRYNTGAWSLYSLSRESDLGYHKLTRDFLQRLCDRLGTPVYCDTAQAFTDQLKIAPPRSRRSRGGSAAASRRSSSSGCRRSRASA